MHNINTWRMEEWRGYGPAAASQIGKSRFCNVHSIEKWAEGIFQQKPEFQSFDSLTTKALLEDMIIFGIRMNRGVDIESLRCRFPDENIEKIKEIFGYWISESWMIRSKSEPNRYYLTGPGRLIADQLALDLLTKSI